MYLPEDIVRGSEADQTPSDRPPPIKSSFRLRTIVSVTVGFINDDSFGWVEQKLRRREEMENVERGICVCVYINS